MRTLLERLLAEPYFARQPPKSTGRETFSDAWLQLALAGRSLPPVDCAGDAGRADGGDNRQARSAIAAARAAEPVRLRRRRLQHRSAATDWRRALPDTRVATTADCGIAPEHVEAAGFAWLAHRYLTGQPGNLPVGDRSAPCSAARSAVPRASAVTAL